MTAIIRLTIIRLHYHKLIIVIFLLKGSYTCINTSKKSRRTQIGFLLFVVPPLTFSTWVPKALTKSGRSRDFPRLLWARAPATFIRNKVGRLTAKLTAIIRLTIIRLHYHKLIIVIFLLKGSYTCINTSKKSRRTQIGFLLFVVPPLTFSTWVPKALTKSGRSRDFPRLLWARAPATFIRNKVGR